VFRGVSNSELGLAVGVFSGDSNTDADYARYVEWLSDLLARHRHLARPVLVQIVERGNPVPNARWRIRIAEAARAVPSDALFVLVSDSPLVRGTARAIGWLAPRAYEMRVCADIEEGLSVVEAWRGVALPELRELHDRACGRVGQAL